MISSKKRSLLALALISLCSAYTYSMDIFKAAEAGDICRVQDLIAQGADVNKLRDSCCWSQTPLYYAAEKGHRDIVQLLLDHGADVNLKNEIGHTALYEAAETGRTEAVQILLEMGARVDLQSRDGLTPLHVAAQAGNTAMVQILLNKGSFINQPDNYGYTPLHRAADFNKKATVEMLMARGANIYLRDRKGKMPLDIAHSQKIADLIRKVMVKNQMTTLARAIHPRLGEQSPAQLLQIGGTYLFPMIASFIQEETDKEAPAASTQPLPLFEPILGYENDLWF